MRKIFTIVFFTVFSLCMLTACQVLRKPLMGPDYSPLREELSEYISTQGGRIGIYFCDLSSGVSFGINEHEPFAAASSIKAPIVLYLFQQVADGKISLDEKMAYQPETDYSGGAGAI